jgi:hypothetical protein
LLIGISFGSAASPAATTEAPPRSSSRRGRIPERAFRSELARVALWLLRKASPFWIILLLVLTFSEHLEPLTLNQRVQGSSPCAPTNFTEQNQHLNLIVPFDVRFDFRRGNACGNKWKISVDDFAPTGRCQRSPVS